MTDVDSRRTRMHTPVPLADRQERGRSPLEECERECERVQEDSRTEAWGLALSRSDDRSTEVFVCYSLERRGLCVLQPCVPSPTLSPTDPVPRGLNTAYMQPLYSVALTTICPVSQSWPRGTGSVGRGAQGQ